jgi:PhnB protein
VIFNRSVPVDAVLPHLEYPDVEEAVVWLTRAFGFVEHYHYGNPVSGAQVRAGNAFLMVKRASSEHLLPAQLGYGAQHLTIFLEDVEAHYRRARDAGAHILEEPHETVYGEFQYAARDLAGHHWLFSRHARELSPEAWGATVVNPDVIPPRIEPVSNPQASMGSITIAPMLSVRRGGAAVEFYTAAFGAETLFRLDGEGGSVVAKLSAGGAHFWVADESPEHKNFSPETLGGATVRMVMVVNDPDRAYQSAIDAGAMVVGPVADQPYGWRLGRLVDPFGHHWEIGRPL